jgi:mono/diheme cytochrome c family protein
LVGPGFTTAISALGALAVFAACSGESDSSQDPAVARGELIYRNICVVCHNADPGQEGTLGPVIVQATRALLEAKVLRGEYPAGYTPARDTRQMPQFQYLEPNLDDIEAFLASRRKSTPAGEDSLGQGR